MGAGAGFSADAGLKVYKDIAKVQVYKQMDMDYADLCDPGLLHSPLSSSIFVGFWGDCYNTYQSTEPHRGYYILHNLLDSLNKKYFVLTSNVDGFFRRIFDEKHVFEMHGTCDEWQCSKKCTKTIF